MRLPTTFAYSGRARVFSYYEVLDEDQFECPCGWAGTLAEADSGLHREVVDAKCPRCDTMLAVRSFATEAETRTAANDGDSRAIAALPDVDRRTVWLVRATSLELKPDSPLPDLDGKDLEFTWDLVDDGSDRWTVIRVGDQVLWRELAYWEGQDRFIAIREILARRYREAFGSLVPSDASGMYLYGDEAPRV